MVLLGTTVKDENFIEINIKDNGEGIPEEIRKKILTPLLQSISFATTPEWLAAFIVFIVLA